MTTYRLQVVIEQDEDGLYVAEVPALKSCFTQGRTFEEAMERIQEVIQMCLQEMIEDGIPVDTRFPEVVGIKFVEVAV